MRELMLREQELAVARLKAQQDAVEAARAAEVERTHRGMEGVARAQQQAFLGATQNAAKSLRHNHFASLPNGMVAPNALLPEGYKESDVER